MALAVLRPLAFGEVLDQAFGLYRRCFVPLLMISLACSGLPALLNLAAQARGGAVTGDLSTAGLSIVALVLSVFGSALANCASTFVVSEQYLGRALEPGEALRRAWPRTGSIISTTLTVGLLTGLGFILLIVPGVIAAAGFSLAVTAAALEGLSSEEARKRSWELTRDFRAHMLGLMMVYGIVLWILVAGFGVVTVILSAAGGTKDPAALAAAATSAPVLITSALGAIVTLAVNPILYCILIVAYYDLRVRKEAFDLDLLATTMEQSAVRR
ncbi:MAG: hypothetical protein JF590_01970 [Gemmatimonadetes bacterium]|nr:hypothetical protein [Gemmatimonadota bacterium]